MTEGKNFWLGLGIKSSKRSSHSFEITILTLNHERYFITALFVRFLYNPPFYFSWQKNAGLHAMFNIREYKDEAAIS